MRRGYRQPFESAYLKVDNNGLCVYCGNHGKVFDHFLPLTVYSRVSLYFPLDYLKPALYQIRSCSTCNMYLGSTVLPSFQARFRFVKNKLRNVYSHVLDLPFWSDSEIAELGRGLKDYVAAGQEAKLWVKERIEWSTTSNPDRATLARIHLPRAVLGSGTVVIAAGTRTGMLDSSELNDQSTIEYVI